MCCVKCIKKNSRIFYNKNKIFEIFHRIVFFTRISDVFEKERRTMNSLIGWH